MAREADKSVEGKGKQTEINFDDCHLLRGKSHRHEKLLDSAFSHDNSGDGGNQLKLTLEAAR
jgi:hypothetical protein